MPTSTDQALPRTVPRNYSPHWLRDGCAFDIYSFCFLVESIDTETYQLGRPFRAVSSRDFELLASTFVVRDEELFDLIQKNFIHLLERG